MVNVYKSVRNDVPRLNLSWDRNLGMLFGISLVENFFSVIKQNLYVKLRRA